MDFTCFRQELLLQCKLHSETWIILQIKLHHYRIVTSYRIEVQKVILRNECKFTHPLPLTGSLWGKWLLVTSMWLSCVLPWGLASELLVGEEDERVGPVDTVGGWLGGSCDKWLVALGAGCGVKLVWALGGWLDWERTFSCDPRGTCGLSSRLVPIKCVSGVVYCTGWVVLGELFTRSAIFHVEQVVGHGFLLAQIMHRMVSRQEIIHYLLNVQCHSTSDRLQKSWKCSSWLELCNSYCTIWLFW